MSPVQPPHDDGWADYRRVVECVFRQQGVVGELFAQLVEMESTRPHEFSLSLTGPWPPYDLVRMHFAS